MTSHRDSHTTTDVYPEMIPGLYTGNWIPHDKFDIRGIVQIRTNRKDDIFMQRRLKLTKHTGRWTYFALRYFCLFWRRLHGSMCHAEAYSCLEVCVVVDVDIVAAATSYNTIWYSKVLPWTGHFQVSNPLCPASNIKQDKCRECSALSFLSHRKQQHQKWGKILPKVCRVKSSSVVWSSFTSLCFRPIRMGVVVFLTFSFCCNATKVNNSVPDWVMAFIQP